MALAFSIGQLRSRTYSKGTVVEQAAELDAAEPRRRFCPRKVPQIEVGVTATAGWLKTTECPRSLQTVGLPCTLAIGT